MTREQPIFGYNVKLRDGTEEIRVVQAANGSKADKYMLAQVLTRRRLTPSEIHLLGKQGVDIEIAEKE